METDLKFKSRKEIALELNVSTKTLCRWIKASGLEIPKGRLLSPWEYEALIKYLKERS